VLLLTRHAFTLRDLNAPQMSRTRLYGAEYKTHVKKFECINLLNGPSGVWDGRSVIYNEKENNKIHLIKGNAGIHSFRFSIKKEL